MENDPLGRHLVDLIYADLDDRGCFNGIDRGTKDEIKEAIYGHIIEVFGEAG